MSESKYTHKLVIGLSYLVISTALISTQANASGSYNNSRAQESYNLGKSVLHNKVICDACPGADIKLNKKSAQDLLKKMKKNDPIASTLSNRDRKAGIKYLSKRFSIQ
jgi:hypothetical protein